MRIDRDDVAILDHYRNEEAQERKQRYAKRCYNCSEPIEQTEAFHLALTTRSGKTADFWICDDCIEKMTEYTGYDDDE